MKVQYELSHKPVSLKVRLVEVKDWLLQSGNFTLQEVTPCPSLGGLRKLFGHI
ncbi:hypothetical protein [Bacillus sp. PK3_68]|uniref:hypothetical protein n=1 Tax=Bacillus sp. PK3_68 TaxID=2027408 RepID=UPI0015FFE899|nr:hypothetical protein [Bacillus sp. PK3_68]